MTPHGAEVIAFEDREYYGGSRRACRDGHSRGTTVECLRTGEAVVRYAELDERHTAAALHLTC